MRQIKAPHRPVLVVASGDNVGTRITVDRTVTLGRDPESDVVLNDDRASWQHARLEDRGDSWTLVDEGSTNGIFVNGSKVAEAVIRPGDKLLFGNTLISFELQDGVAAAANEAVQRLLNVDDLSGLLVRRKFDAELVNMIDVARARGDSVALLVMDLDGVKAINDTNGHLFGAYTIGQAGRVIGSVVGRRGICCRFGGDEYLAALPEMGRAAGVEVAEEIRAAIGAHHFEREGIVLRPGISIGVAAFPGDAGDAVQLFERADAALYRAKTAGKNCVKV